MPDWNGASCLFFRKAEGRSAILKVKGLTAATPFIFSGGKSGKRKRKEDKNARRYGRSRVGSEGAASILSSHQFPLAAGHFRSNTQHPALHIELPAEESSPSSIFLPSSMAFPYMEAVVGMPSLSVYNQLWNLTLSLSSSSLLSCL